MNLLRCIVVDDNELDRLTIKSYLSHFPEIEVVGIYPSPKEALEAISVTNPDIVFLDVDMPDMTGLELRKQILNIPVCIFTTDYADYAVDSFELETLDYLLKPYSLERFTKTINRIKEYLEIKEKAAEFETQQEENEFFIKEGNRKIKITIDEVLYLNAMQNYTVIVTNMKKYYVLSSLTSFLANNHHFSSFMRIHRSFAVNPKHLQEINSQTVILSNDDELPVGRSYKKNINSIGQ